MNTFLWVGYAIIDSVIQNNTLWDRLIVTLFRRSHLHIRITFSKTFSTTCTEAMLEIFGGDYCTSLHTLRGRCGDIQLCGYMSTVAYPGRKIKLITLNQRVVNCSRIQQTIDAQLKGSNISVPISQLDQGEDLTNFY